MIPQQHLANLFAGSVLNTADFHWGVTGLIPGQTNIFRFLLGEAHCTIGRSPDANVSLPSKNVSKYHANLIVTNGVAILSDLGSRNGTFVNGRRIFDPTPVGEGDYLQFADVELRLFRESRSEPDYTCVSEQQETKWLLSSMQRVLSEREFEIHFQPVISASGDRYGVEALVRTSIPGLESPLRLFEAASRLGQSGALSRLCRQEAIRQLDQTSFGGALFLNTDPAEPLDGSLVQEMKTLRQKAGSRQIVLEIHEESVTNASMIQDFSDELRRNRIAIAFDDFGAGQSRLLEIAQVRPDILKFDRSLIVSLAETTSPQAHLIRSLHACAKDLGIRTLAEGVESETVIEACRDIQFDLYQGYAFGRPVSAQKLFRSQDA
ncbi:MAG: EAL domain-containing protein [Planctomyces sp.]|nr:EAL domain-containing protein [Planctomyces sp.]